MSQLNIPREDILGFECKHAVYCKPPSPGEDDIHFVKENIHLKDGRVIPNIRMIRNYKRSFWITKQGCRVHKQKKEREDIKRLTRYETTESQMLYNVARALDMPWYRGTMRELCNSPYVYGTDIFSTALIKGDYRTRFPSCFSPSSMAAFDTETSMVDGSILMGSLTFGSRVITAVRRDYFDGYADPIGRTKAAVMENLGEYFEERKIDWELVIVDEEVDVIRRCFEKAHEWRPDFVSIWNIDFDLPKMIEACERAGVDPKDVFSDPAVPKEYRFFKYHQGRKVKVMASGKESPINVADQWHTVFVPASFYFIDSMCVYRKLRVQRGELPSYSLDYILNLELGKRKLRFSQADKFTGGDWHDIMQTQYKAEYVAYNIFDCIGMELLDEKIKDISMDVPIACTYSDYRSFESQPKRVVDQLHYYLMDEHNSIIGSTGKVMVDDVEKIIPPNTDLIVNLKAYLIEEEGLRCIKGYPEHRTRFYRHTYDLDVSAAYPTNTIVFNVGRETCTKILCRVEGKTERDMRMNTINFSAGHTNSLEFCQSMFGLPDMRSMLDIYQKAKQERPTTVVEI